MDRECELVVDWLYLDADMAGTEYEVRLVDARQSQID